MQLKEIVIDRTLRELTPRGTPSFPIEMYHNDISKFVTHYVPWHWHKEVEFVYVLKGIITVENNGNIVDLSCGDGAFINKNQLHAMRSINNESCDIINIVFDTEIIAGSPHSIYESKYVLPLTKNNEIDIVLLKPAIAWQNTILKMLIEAFQIYTKADYGYEMYIRNYLSHIWLSLFKESSKIVPVNQKPESLRIKNILTYIHENYMNVILLKDIAHSAGVGVRTCCRYFQQQMGMTPFEYLTEYRIKVAAKMLVDTDKSITDICFIAGFNNTSYFAKIFRKITGYTPTAFRKKQTTLINTERMN